MRFSSWLAAFAVAAAPAMAAEPMLVSKSLNTCQDNSNFTASLFHVVFTPLNGSANVDIVAVSSIQGSVVFDISITAYGYQAFRRTVDPCTSNLAGLCPMTAGKIPLNFNLNVGPDAAKIIPGIAYNIPDLDAVVRVFLNSTETGESLACVEANISNGKTVDLLGVKWATAIVAGLALAASAVVSGLGHSNTAAHVAANTLSLFGYFQAQAIVGLTGVHLPPIVMAWTQDFQWTMGIIRVGFMQTIFTWYQRATGGTPSTLFSSLGTVSVQVEKRSVDTALDMAVDSALSLFRRSVAAAPSVVRLLKRANIMTESNSFIVYGIQRVAFIAKIESTNLFMTGLTFYCVFVVLTILGVAAFKGFCEVAVKNKWMKSDKFLDFRNGWFTVLKGILFRLTLIGYPQMTILCLWEFTQRDSAAEVVLAVFFFFGMTLTLGWAASKVIRIARRSVAMHRNPAYILFSDPQALNKWGFLYVQFRAPAYYFIVPVLGYTLVKGMFVAFGQHNMILQAIAFVIIEAAALIAASVLRPWMDKSTNTFNIAICAVNFINSIFLLIFCNVFSQPGLVTGIIGVVFFILNAAFSLILLITIIITTVVIFFRKNPDTRYQVMGDDRTSFMKSQTQLTTTTELDALAAAARGDKAVMGGYNGSKHLDLDDDAASISSHEVHRRAMAQDATGAVRPSTSHSAVGGYAHNNNHGHGHVGHAPGSPSVPLFPADARRGPNNGGGGYSQPQRDYHGGGGGYGGYAGGHHGGQSDPYLRSQHSGHDFNRRSPSPYNHSASTGNLSQGYRSQNNASPRPGGAA